AASRWTWERARSPLFAEEIPAPDPDAMIAEYRRKAEGWERMERRFIWRAHRFRRLVARRVSAEKLAELDTRRSRLPGDPATGPTFGDSSWSGSLAASHKGGRAGGDVARKSMDQWYLASTTSSRPRSGSSDSRMISVSKCPRKRLPT